LISSRHSTENDSLKQVSNCGHFNVLYVISVGRLSSFVDDLGAKHRYF
jgi:hypothetical protein